VASVAFTFDDGPDPQGTPLVLDALERHGVRATFFVRGDHLAAHPDVAREALAGGHELQPHCWEHRSHREMSRDEIARDVERVLAALRKHAGVESPTLWRPAFGHIRAPATYDVARAHGVEVVTWTLETCDWAGHSAERMWRDIVEEARPAAALRADSVVLMHDPMGEETAKLVERLVPEVRRRGWSLGGSCRREGRPRRSPRARRSCWRSSRVRGSRGRSCPGR
jgi:peptidoglycan-N-acetylglucosamine deacetylase